MISVVAPVVMVAPFFVCFMLVVPVFLIAVVVAAADEFLVVAFATEVVIIAAVLVEMQVRLRIVDDYLVTVIEIEVMVAGGQLAGEDPTAFTLVDELMIGDVVVRLDVRDVIVFDVIVTRGAPGGLNADVDGEMNLGLCGVGKDDANEDGACQEKLFHTF